MTPKKERALLALLSCPTAREAARVAGIHESTLRTYWKDPAFVQAYRERCAGMLQDATNKAKQTLPPAVERLALIVSDDSAPAQQQIAAARAVLEYGLRLIEANDFEQRLRALEERSRNEQ